MIPEFNAPAPMVFPYSTESPSELYFFLDNFERTLQEYHDQFAPSIGWDPLNATTHRRIGMIHADHKSLEQAEAEFEIALRMDPADAHTHVELGKLYQQRKWSQKATRSYKKAVALQPGLATAHSSLGQMYMSQKHYRLAERELIKAVKLDPKDTEAFLQLGNIYYYIKRNFPKAKRSYNAALKLNPNLSSAHTVLDKIAKAQQVAREKEEEFEEAIIFDDDFTQESDANLQNGFFQF